MIVECPTVSGAARVAELTGGTQLPAKTQPTPGVVKLSRRVDVGHDFEPHRAAVESVSLLFSLLDNTSGTEVPVASGWSVTAAKFEVAWPTDPERAGLVRSHFGARRFAYNWALGQVKADMDARTADPSHASVDWSLAALRKHFNCVKGTVAPWWATNSKEAYASGIADLATALANWRTSRAGLRKGRAVGFPRFKAKARIRDSVRFTTGTMRLDTDRHHITVPVIGSLRTKENTRRVQRKIAAGNAKILSMTLSQQWGRLFVAINYAVRTAPIRQVALPTVRAGVDLGLRFYATISTVDTVTGETGRIVVPNPAPLRASLIARKAAGRQLSRRIPGSKGYRSAKAKLTAMDRRAVNIRQETSHQLTSMLAGIFGEIIIEDLDLAAMKRSMGRRAFRRSVSDAALGSIRPQLAYKTQATTATLTVADRWFPSSQIHHGCPGIDGARDAQERCRLIAPTRLAKQLICPATQEPVDRDDNAADNLRDWPGHASCSTVSAAAPHVSSFASGGEDVGLVLHPVQDERVDVRPSTSVEAVRGEAGTRTPQGDASG
ncbi:MAG: IS607 family element RNA-guided endonuclease TnpB [Nakamurella sp.]